MHEPVIEGQTPNGVQALPHPARLWLSGGLAITVLLIYGAVRVDSLVDWACLASISLVSVIPCMLWLRMWRSTMPIVPLFAVMHVLNFALPFASTSSAVSEYDDEIKISATLVVCAFLAILTVVWALAIYVFPARQRSEFEYDTALVLKYLPYGLVISAIFSWFSLSGEAYALGDWMPVARAMFGTAFAICAYLFGVLWGKRRISQRLFLFCVGVLCANVVLFWATLYLYSGIFAVAAVLVGYTFGSGRVPMVVVAVVIATVTVLHAGKTAMRERYWGDEAVATFSVQRVPQFMAEWVGEGVRSLFGSRDDASYILLDRVGLIHMLMRVMSLTPTAVDYLRGETYELIPAMMVPRFINPDKPSMREGQILLNIRYGVMTPEESETTAVGWGLLSEAYANFGTQGAVSLAVILGLFFALATVLTSGASPLSMRTVFGIVVLVTMVNLEGDTALFMTVLLQATIAAMMLLAIVRLFAVKPAREVRLDTGTIPRQIR